jgi:hypothetical protein
VLCLDFEFDVDPMQQALDGSGFENHATANAVSSTSTNVATNPVDLRAALFNGTDSELRVAETPKLNLTTAFTLEAWVVRQLGVVGGWEYFIVDSSGQFSLSIQDNNSLRCAINGGSGNSTRDVASGADVPVGDGRWHHVACTWDPDKGGTLKVFIDGAVDDCESNTGPIVETAGATTIGARTNGGVTDHYLGILDNVHVYDRALQPSELCSHANKTDCKAECPKGGIVIEL